MNVKNFYSKLTMLPPDGAAPGTPPAADPAAAPPAPADPPAAAPAAPDYSWAPESFVKDGQFDAQGLRASYDELSAFKAQVDEARAAVPGKPEDYQMTVPDSIDMGDLPLPDGFKFELSDDPRIAPVMDGMKGFLHKHHLPQEAASELLGLLGKYEAIGYSDLYASTKKEAEALGPQAEARVATVVRSLESKLPADLATALKAATYTANGVKALETLLKPTTFGAPPGSPPGVDTENMTPAQRLAYANQKAAAR